MRIVNDQQAAKVGLVHPTGAGFVLFAAEVGTWIGPFLPPSRARSAVVELLRATVAELERLPQVEEARVFRGALRPPGEGVDVLAARGLAPARYDVVVLVRTSDIAAATALRDDPIYRDAVDEAERRSRRSYELVATNDGRSGDVDHRPIHRFLFNYFYADDTDTVRKVWEYTAGWFQAKTGLPNSVLMRPVDGESADFAIVNHASWPSFRAFLPSLLFRPSFRSFVLANFKANDIAAQPIIYQRV